MSIESVGFRASDQLTPNMLFRVTLADHWYNASSFTFPDAARALYDSLLQKVHLIPTVPLTVVTGDKIAVFDANLKTNERGADLLNALEVVSSTWCFVSKVELLQGDDRANSSSQDGADARDAERDDTTKKADAENVFAKTWAALGTAGTIVKWVGVIVLLGAIFYFGAPYLTRKK